MKKPTLKPCPFCNGEAQIISMFQYDIYMYACACSECPVFTGYQDTKAKAIKAWNTRSTPQCCSKPNFRVCIECFAQTCYNCGTAR